MGKSLGKTVCFGLLLPPSEGERLYCLTEDVDWISDGREPLTGVVIIAFHWHDDYLGFILAAAGSCAESWSEPAPLDTSMMTEENEVKWTGEILEFVREHRIFLTDAEDKPQWYVGAEYW